MPKPTFTIGVFATIFNEENRILFCLRNDNKKWDLPGGRLERGESPWEGVVREVKEETGLNVKVEKLTGVFSRKNHNDIIFQFICKVTGGKIMLNEEAGKIKYFAFDDIPRNHNKNHIERLKCYLDNPDIVSAKIQRN